MKKKPTVVDFQQRRGSSAVDVLERMLASPATRSLLEKPGTRVLKSHDPNTRKTVFSFRAADYTGDDQESG